ncbi:hypothetical protein BJV82DRAFT_607507 [Fennellomyces sp. T-0311]|nr:hypothetical protein BJV82DRAFT_607507 [Fennellomyces sp. T-0311]
MEIRDRNETYSAVSLPTYRLKNKNGTHSNVPIAEMMAQTFVGVFPDNKTHYIFYKDGVPNNCTMANLTVCSFSELQALERQRLETEYSGVKFTVVKTDDDLLTRYLVGDNGQVYDIIKHSFRKVVERTPTRFLVRLEGSDSGRYIQVSQVVLESFVGPCEKGYRIVHLDGDSSNNTLENLKYMTKRQHTLWQHKVNPPAYTPSPPVTKDTKWAPVGTLPWNKISYPLYEVSNMGHVRLKDSKELIKIQRTVKTAAVSMEHGKNADGTPQMHVERVARLVANCFVTPGYTATRCFVKHLNRDRHDNTSKNLQWVEQRAALTRPPPLKVVVKLLDEPATQKSFDSKAKAAKKLKEKSILSIRRGDSAKKTVFWDNRYRDTIVQIL